MSTPSTARFSAAVIGEVSASRRSVDSTAAFAAFCRCDPRLPSDAAAFLTQYTFGQEFHNHLIATGGTRNFRGPCAAEWLHFDVDNADLEQSLTAARRLVAGIQQRFEISDEDLLIYFSGKKGFHVGIPASLYGAPPASENYHRTARNFCTTFAASIGIEVDASVYDKVRIFRAPNSRHPDTGRFKRRVSRQELERLPVAEIIELASERLAFEVPAGVPSSEVAINDWKIAEEAVRQQAALNVALHKEPRTQLNRDTLDFIKEGAPQGNRNNRLFAAALNLRDFECPPILTHALLTPTALDSGLSPSEVVRTIDSAYMFQRNL